MNDVMPKLVITAIAGEPTARVNELVLTPIVSGMGAATADVTRVTGSVSTSRGELLEVSLVRKRVRPVAAGRHVVGSHTPGHFAYWRREPLAYSSGALPVGPGLRAPLCYAVEDSTIYMENVPAGTVDMRQVAAHLGEWNSTSAIPRVDWLTRDQLAQRIDGTDLDWKSVNGDRRAVTIWEARHELLERLATFPRELSHGDVNPNNVFESRGNTVVVDWQAFGIAPAGADLAALTLQTREDLLPDYLGALDKHCSRETAEYAYRATLALLGASQYHWFLVRGEPPDDGYLDFVWENRPLLKR